MDNFETKWLGGNIREVKEGTRNGTVIGIIAGYIATWDEDRCGDIFVKGCFAESLEEHRNKKRQIRMKGYHGELIGGFPIEGVFEDNIGLYGRGEVNLETQLGGEIYSLAKQGVITDFSIGFSSLVDRFEEGRRIIDKAVVWEGSLVDEPMNPNAIITEVKTVVAFQDLPLADRGRRWDAGAAKKRLRTYAGAEEGLTSSTIQKKYSRGFLWYDQSAPEEFGSYKLPIADVMDGTLTAIPRGIFAAAGRLNQTDVPANDKKRIIGHINRYYDKMDMPSPFREESSFRIDDFKALTERELEDILRKGVAFSKNNAKVIIATLKAAGLRDEGDGSHRDDGDFDWSETIAELKNIKNLLEDKLNV